MEPPKHLQLRFVSWNTMGIRYTEERSYKFQLVLDELINLKANVVFVQETHIGPQSYEVLESIQGWRSFFTVHHPRSKGVAILIKNETIFCHICHDEDYSGGYIVLFCRLYGQLFTLVNVYNHRADRRMLDRLRNYLTTINTKGVLVVGGDFNTVLDPTFDRRSAGDQTYQSSLRSILEDFTDSLSLKDTFGLMHPMKEGFTRSQNQSHSRLDMFFMPTNIEHYVIKCVNHQAKMRKSTNGKKKISDHGPLVLDIKVPVLLEYKMPEVASMVIEFKYRRAPDRRAGKINGAEILDAIRSLPDSQQQTPDKLSVYDYKKNDLPLTEILKINYNMMLKSKYVPKRFVKPLPVSNNMHCFNIDYLIFAQILAKRLEVFLKSSFRGKKRVTSGDRICVTFAKCSQKIKMSFLKRCLSSLKQITPTPPKDFSILENLLPKASSNNDYRKLRQGCPLATAILTMALKQLKRDIMATRKSSGNTSVCKFRQSLLICINNQQIHRILELLKEFEKCSGIKIHFTHHRVRH
ncbi:uncharacterized protein [Sinocyclocheilus grahami]|uniref:uncharacterized protein n=1 Tax=Sinocyclocheilus grahami TaxID=75366 RepID=UPI0007AD67EA|nr:PREDICTED: uncharacterized protein LOC107577218 [Sinocyclocheilus grahami]